jgi:hypothetical protein
MYVRAGGRNNDGPSANRDDNSLLRYVTGSRCRKSPPTVSLSRCVLSSSPMLRFLPDFHHNLAQTPIPVRAQRSRRQAQIVPPPLRQAHPRSGTRQGQAPGAHYPNASAARHRLLFAASRTQERCREVKQARQPLATELWSREKRSVACCCLGDYPRLMMLIGELSCRPFLNKVVSPSQSV